MSESRTASVSGDGRVHHRPWKDLCANTFVVPANRLLVVETVSGFITVPPGQTAFQLNTSHEPFNDVSFFKPATFVSNDGTNLRFAVTQSMRAYAFPGTHVVGIGSRSAPSLAAEARLPRYRATS